MTFDWKFWLMLLVTIAAAAIPVWLWQIDLNSKALQVNVNSVSELAKDVDSKLELKVFQGTTALKNPVLSVLEVVNVGGRPILAAEFESPLVIDLGKDVVVRTATVGKATPDNLRPSLEVSGSSVHVKPMLLNAGDRFELSILHDELPVFTADARIAAVRQVAVQLNSATEKQKRRAWFQLLAAVPIFSCYMLCFFAALTLSMPHAVRIVLLALGAGCGFGASFLSTSLMHSLEINKVWFAVAAGGISGLLLFPVFYRLGRLVRQQGWPLRISVHRIRL